MTKLKVDDTRFIVVKPKLKSIGILAKRLEREYKVKVIFLKKITKAPYAVAFVLPRQGNRVFIRYDLAETTFNHVIFHEIRHIQQGLTNSYILYRGPENNKQGDVVRYLFDCLSCEVDADMFAIRECAARQLEACRPHYLGSAKSFWVKFLDMYAKESCGEYNVSQKQLRAIVSLLFDPMRPKKIRK